MYTAVLLKHFSISEKSTFYQNMDGMVGKILSVFRILPFWPTLQQINLKKNNTKNTGIYGRGSGDNLSRHALHSPDKCPRAAGHPDQMSSWHYVFLTQRLLTHKLIFQIFVNHQKATKPLTRANCYRKVRELILIMIQ